MAWGGGETPALAGIVESGRIDLASSCTGIVQPKSRLSVGDDLQAGDAIVLLSSSGIHANGLSLARKLVERLPHGYMTPVEPGLSYGEALLAPTTLYSPVTEALAHAGLTVHYSANITGHGWRKLLRHPKPFTYRITTVPPVPPVLAFIQHHARHDAREAYSTLNMGAGFALFMPADQAAQTLPDRRGSRHPGACIAGADRGRPEAAPDRGRAEHPLRRRRPAAALKARPAPRRILSFAPGGCRPRVFVVRARTIGSAFHLRAEHQGGGPGRGVAYNRSVTGLPAWKHGQPGQVGNEAALTVVTSAGVRLVTYSQRPPEWRSFSFRCGVVGWVRSRAQTTHKAHHSTPSTRGPQRRRETV